MKYERCTISYCHSPITQYLNTIVIILWTSFVPIENTYVLQMNHATTKWNWISKIVAKNHNKPVTIKYLERQKSLLHIHLKQTIWSQLDPWSHVFSLLFTYAPNKWWKTSRIFDPIILKKGTLDSTIRGC